MITSEVSGPDTELKTHGIKKSLYSTPYTVHKRCTSSTRTDGLRTKVGRLCAGPLCPGGSPRPFLPLQPCVTTQFPTSGEAGNQTGLGRPLAEGREDGGGRAKTEPFGRHAAGAPRKVFALTNFAPVVGCAQHLLLRGARELTTC